MNSSRTRTEGKKGKRHGFILMEVIVAMTLLALIMTPLAAMVFKITARSHRSIGNTYRNAIVMKEVNLLEAIAYDSLATGTTTTTVTGGVYPYTKTLTVAQYYQRFMLKGKTVQERAQALIAIAHPDFREDLERAARDNNIICKGFG